MKYSYIVLTLILVFSCKSRKNMIYLTQPTYADFRARQNTFESDIGKIKFIDKGKGEAIVFLHGIPTSGWLYRKMIDSLVNKNFRVIVPDMLGFGSSDSPKGYEIYSPEAHGKRLLALMDNLQIDTWNHVFHDAGGLWTWELLKMAPDRINKMIILNSIIYEKGFNPPMRFKRGNFTKLSMSFYSNKLTNRTIMKKLFKNALIENNLTPNEIEGYRKPLLEGKTDALYAFFSSTCDVFPDYKETLKNANVSSMVIWGKHDQMLQWEPMAKDVIKDLSIKLEDVHVIEAKHYIQEESTSQISGLIVDFIR